MSEPKLKPCPFCGGEAKLINILNYYGDIYWVKCEECNAETPSDFEKDEAIAAWNRRANDEHADC